MNRYLSIYRRGLKPPAGVTPPVVAPPFNPNAGGVPGVTPVPNIPSSFGVGTGAATPNSVNSFLQTMRARRPGGAGGTGTPLAAAPDYSLAANTARSNTAMSSAGATGASAEAEGYSRTAAFDPNAAIQRYAKGAWDTVMNDPVSGLKRSLSDLRGSAVGAGRLDTGFFDQDQGDVINNATRGFQNSLASTAVQGANMEQRNNAEILGYGTDKTNQYLDLLTAEREQQTNDARDKAERQRRKKRGIGSLIGGAIGAVGGSFIPGVGTAAGWGIGSQAGGSF